jgi:hypothetical protein
MDPAHELARERQQEMLTKAAAQRQAYRVHALDRADRRAARARRALSQSRHRAMRLRGELAAEQES